MVHNNVHPHTNGGTSHTCDLLNAPNGIDDDDDDEEEEEEEDHDDKAYNGSDDSGDDKKSDNKDSISSWERWATLTICSPQSVVNNR